LNTYHKIGKRGQNFCKGKQIKNADSAGNRDKMKSEKEKRDHENRERAERGLIFQRTEEGYEPIKKILMKAGKWE